MGQRITRTAMLGVATLVAATAWAEGAPPPPGTRDGKPSRSEEPEPAATTQASTEKAAAPVSCKWAMPAAPLYVEDWGRLADLTRPDPAVFEKADSWRNRHESSRWLLVGVLFGGGAATVATIDRLGNGTWTDTNKWGLAGGLTVAAASLLAYWAFSPDRDDRLTVINHWNLRHPDRPLAP